MTDKVAPTAYTIPSRQAPEGLACLQKPTCAACPQAAAHASYYRGEIQSELPEASRISTKDMRDVQWALHRAHTDFGLLGWNGELVPAVNSYNYSDGVTWNLVSVSGSTLVLEHASADPRNLLLAQGADGVEYRGVVQPGDVIRFNYPSVRAETDHPRVRRITACTSTTLTITVDRDCTGADVSADVEDPDADITLATWREVGEFEQWTRIVDPTFLNCEQRTVTITASDLDANDHVLLKNSRGENCAIAHYLPATGIWGPTFGVMATPIGGGTPVDITADICDESEPRVYVQSGEGGNSTLMAFGEFNRSLASYGDDLLETYESFAVSYYAEVANGGLAPCYSRCRYAIRDYSNSVGNYTAVGTGVDSDGNHWFCGRRKYYVRALDEDDNWVYTYYYPTGRDDFPADGQCKQWNVCDAWEPLEQVGGAPLGNDSWPENVGGANLPGHPFKVWDGFARWIRDCWARVKTKQDQGLNSVDVTTWRWQAVGTPSLRNILGGWTFHPPVGFHQLVTALQWGGGFGRVKDVTDSGDTRMQLRSGSDWDASYDFIGYEAFREGVFVPIDEGHFPALVDNWKTRTNAENKSQNYSDASDPTKVLRYTEVRAGLSIGRDVLLTSGGRGYHLYTQVTADEPVYCERVDIASKDSEQNRTEVSFWHYTTPVDKDGLSCTGRLQFVQMITNDKSAVTLATREVAVITGSGTVWNVDFTNEGHIQTTQAGGEDVTNAFDAGGCAGFIAVDYMRPNDFNDSPAWGAGNVMPGDTAWINGKCYVVKTAEPHGGSEASGWGTGYTPTDSLAICGQYTTYGKRRDRAVLLGDLSGVSVGASVEFKACAGYWHTDPAVYYAAYGTDSWTQVNSVHLWYDNATGQIWIAKTVMDTLSGEVCFRV